MKLDIIDRFFSHVEKTEACWLWIGYRNRQGYGRFGVGSRVVYAHRWLYEQSIGPVPSGLDLDHLCRQKACVNPAHLEPVTRGENLRRGDGPRLRAAHFAARRHCKRGHELTPENTYRDAKGHRVCRACVRLKTRAWAKANRAYFREWKRRRREAHS